MAPFLRFLLLLGACVVGWGCVSTASESERPCPCAEGWLCCVENQKCVRDAAQCPGGEIYTPNDTTAPAAPRLETAMPGSPTAQVRVTVAGTSEAYARVRLFDDPACGGSSLGEGKADSAGGFRVEVELARNTLTTLYGVAVDAVGNVSLCSAEPLRLTQDDQAPEAPALAETVPASPSATHLYPVLSGTAEAGARVRVFADAGCERALSFETQTDAAGTFRVSVSVERNTPTTFWARATDAAGNVSACSTSGLSYTQDDVPPVVPLLETVPASPSTSLEPLWKGVTEPGALVRLYAEEGCFGAPLVELRADAEGRFGVRQTARANGSVSRWVRVTDVTGNTSACYALGTYVHDDLPPREPTLSSFPQPYSPSNQTDSPFFTGSAEPGATVLLVREGTCSESEVARGTADLQNGDWRLQAKVDPYPTGGGGSLSVRARTVDAAGNLSPCSYNVASYVYDTRPPEPPALAVLTEPSPSASADPPSLMLGSYSRSDADVVSVYTVAGCLPDQYAPSFGASWWNGSYPSVRLARSSTELTFYVQVRDRAGNSSACIPLGLRFVNPMDVPGGRLRWHAPAPLGSGASAGWAMDGEGHAFAASVIRDNWASPRAVVWRTDETGAWGTAYALSFTPSISSAAPVVAANTRGDAVVAWWEADGSVRVVRYTPAVGWGASAELIPAKRGAHQLSLGVDADGNALATWVESFTSGGLTSNVLVGRSAAAAAEWGEAQPVPRPPFADSPRFIVSPSGGVLVWMQPSTTPTTSEVRGRLYTQASGWGEEQLINTDASGMVAAVDAGGTVWLASKRARSPSGAHVWVQSLAPGATGWSEPERLSPDTGVASEVELQVVGGRADEAMVAWGSFNRGSFGQAWSRHHAAGGDWGALLEIGDRTFNPEGHRLNQLRLVSGLDGEVYAAFVQRFGPVPSGRSYPIEWLRLRRFSPSEGWAVQTQTLRRGLENVVLNGFMSTPKGQVLAIWKEYDGATEPSGVNTRWLR